MLVGLISFSGELMDEAVASLNTTPYLQLANSLNNISATVASKASQETDATKKAELQTLSAAYKSVYEGLSSLTTEFSSTRGSLLLATTDLLHLLEHYTQAQTDLSQLYTNTETMKSELSKYSSHTADLTPLYQHIVDTADNHVNISIDILTARVGNCAILADIYDIVTEFFYFSVVR